jgi:glycosyltransferase involved in cell wall biosynthesis
MLKEKIKFNNPTISVIMSVYNEERYIETAVKSILLQTFNDFEFIIINDGSTDKTLDILNSFNDKRLVIVNQENQGLTKSLNKALKMANGKYIARMDGNDCSLPKRFEKQVEILNNDKNIGLVGTFYYTIDTKGKRIKIYKYATEYNEIKKRIYFENQFCHSSVMLRKECIESIGLYREKIGPAEDYDLWLRIIEKYRAVNIAEPLHEVRIVPEGITLNNRFNQIRAAKLALYMAEKRINNLIDDLESLDESKISELLDKIMPKNKKNITAVSYSTNIYLAEVFYLTENHKESLKKLLIAFKLNPFSNRNFTLLIKLILNMILPKSLLLLLKSR